MRDVRFVRYARTQRKTRETSRRKLRQSAEITTLTKTVKQYDLLSSITHASTGVIVGQLLRGDAKEAEAVDRKRLCGRTGRKVMATVKKTTVSHEAVFDDSKGLELVEVSVFASTAQLLFKSGAVPKVRAESLCSQLHL